MQKSERTNASFVDGLCHDFSGPVLFQYVWWILKTALDKKIDRLYFMARDGYLLLKIAEKFCQKFLLPVECRYLYCSRNSLRMPSYHLIGDEAYDLLFLDGYYVTPRSLLERIELDRQDRLRVYMDCGCPDIDEERQLSEQELAALQLVLRRSPVLRKMIVEKSRSSYADTLGYLKQEGLFDSNQIALVDSGWTGSMQRSLRQLLRSANCTAEITGFYFGMSAAPKSQEDGTYLTWYFDHRGRTVDKIHFCNNLFECLLSAPHGMTIRYAKKKDRYIPVFTSAPEQEAQKRIYAHMHGVLKYTEESLEKIDFGVFQKRIHKKDTRQRLVRYMVHPTAEEVLFHGLNQFCDDVTESYHLPLADRAQVLGLKDYQVLPRALRKLGWIRSKQNARLLWPYGTIALLPAWKQPWYRWNIYLWEWIRYARR